MMDYEYLLKLTTAAVYFLAAVVLFLDLFVWRIV